ncbi:hypothetical protein GQ42DRAFT_11814 [Ramicandelaber brevisporus]|nr:hypothetical protein GQ42DRAFT_11814 [Ramicandelaber brevisporus]
MPVSRPANEQAPFNAHCSLFAAHCSLPTLRSIPASAASTRPAAVERLHSRRRCCARASAGMAGRSDAVIYPASRVCLHSSFRLCLLVCRPSLSMHAWLTPSSCLSECDADK